MGFLVTPPVSRVIAAAGLAAVLCVSACAQSAQDHEATGDRYYKEKQYGKAILEYKNALKINTQLGGVRSKLGRAYEQVGDTPRAVGEYIRAADLLPGDTALQIVAIRAFLTSGRFEDARTRAERILEKDPKNAQAQGLLGNALIGMRDPQAALKEIEEAIRLDPTNITSHTALGALKLGEGDLESAEAAFKRAAAIDHQSVTPTLSLANFYWWAGRTADAESTFKQALAIKADDPLANRTFAVFYISTGRPALAEPYLQKLAQSDEGSAGNLLGDFYMGQKQNDKALQVLHKVASGKDKNAAVDAKWRLASLAYASGNKVEAHKTLDAVLKENPTASRALLIKSDFLRKENKLDEALTYAKAAAAADPQFASAHYAIGMIYRAKNDLDSALQSLNEALRLNPRAATAELALAQTHMLQDNFPKSVNYAREALNTEPGNVEARLTLATDLIAQGNGADALAELKPLAALYPHAAQVQAYIGAANLVQKNQPAAKAAFERALQIDPSSSDALAGLVSMDLDARRIAAAQARLDAAHAQDSKAPTMLALAAQVYAASGDSAKSEAMWLKVIELDPSNLRAYEILGRYYIKLNRLDAARAQFEMLSSRRPSNVSAQTMVALLLAAENKTDEARARFERVLEIDPRAAVAANNLAWIYAESDGNLDRALELAQTAKSVLANEPQVDDTLGWVYYKKELIPSALPLLKASVDKSPNEPTYHYHLGLAYAKSGDKVRARQSLETALRLAPNFPESADAKRVLATL